MTEANLSRLGRLLREAQDRVPPTAEEHAVGTRLVEDARHPQRLRRTMASGRLVLTLGLATAASLTTVWLVRRPSPLTLQVSQPRTTHAPPSEAFAGSWLPTQESERLLTFSDGSHVTLTPDSQVRVERLDADGARVLLERGLVHVSIQHRPSARWSFSAGPFNVTVLGTRFSLGWDPAAQRLDLQLHEGAVTLAGPVVGPSRRVQNGEALAVSVRDGRVEAHDESQQPHDESQRVYDGEQEKSEGTTSEAPAPAPAHAHTPREDTVPNEQRPSNPTHVRPEGTRAGSPEKSAGTAPSWTALARSGRYAEALATAEAAGFEAICRTGPPDELRMLGDTARLAGNAVRAQQAFVAMRTRFARSSHAGTASFLLGKLSFDQTRRFGESVDWFTTYLREQPNGPFAREAAGRLIEALRMNGNEEGARRAATQYLSRYPDGPHGDLARALLGH